MEPCRPGLTASAPGRRSRPLRPVEALPPRSPRACVLHLSGSCAEQGRQILQFRDGSCDGLLVRSALQELRKLIPMPLRGIDVDNDTAFMNEELERWCAEARVPVELARSRAAAPPAPAPAGSGAACCTGQSPRPEKPGIQSATQNRCCPAAAMPARSAV